MEWMVLVLAAYLLGSIPNGLLVGRARGVDLREHGSRNIGATNAGRVLGRKYGLAVFFLDALKGFLPALVGQRFYSDVAAAAGLLAGVAAILGHMFPIYLRFRGGKGVATAAGVFLGLTPLSAGMALLTWAFVLFCSRMVAAASLVAAWVFPPLMIFLDGGLTREKLPACIASMAVAALITWRHSTNIGRILRGEEPRISLARK